MYRLEFEQAVGRKVSDEDFGKAELVLMNTPGITSTRMIAKIYTAWGSEAMDILYLLVKEKADLTYTIGKLKDEISDIRKENRRLREFRDSVIKEAVRKLPSDTAGDNPKL